MVTFLFEKFKIVEPFDNLRFSSSYTSICLKFSGISFKLIIDSCPVVFTLVVTIGFLNSFIRLFVNA